MIINQQLERLEEPVSVERCSVCGEELDAGTLPLIRLRVGRSPQTWTKCPTCRSFFAVASYSVDEEISHTRTRDWGNVETGVSLGEAKAPLFEAVLRAIRPFAVQGSALLDVGCSYGTFLERARSEGYKVRGFDIVPEAVEYVRSRGIVCDHAASVAELDIVDGSQDIITALDCNSYWPDHRRELRAIRARLRPGGLLVMRAVDTSWVVRLGMHIARWRPSVGRRLCERALYDHRVSVPADSLLELVSREGFTVLYTSVRDAVPFRRNPVKARLAYALGRVSWRVARFNLAPGFMFLSRKNSE